MRSKDAQKQLTQTSLKRQRDLLGIKKSGFNTSRSTAGTLLTRHLLEYWAQKKYDRRECIVSEFILISEKKTSSHARRILVPLKVFFFQNFRQGPPLFLYESTPTGGGGRRGRGKALRFSSSQLQVQNLLWQGFTSE